MSNKSNYISDILSHNISLADTVHLEDYWDEEHFKVFMYILITLLILLCIIAIIECVRAWKENKRYTFQQNEQRNRMFMHAL